MDSEGESYPALKAALESGAVTRGSGKPGKREPRCGPWDEREDGAIVCRKCGDIDYPNSTPGPFGF